jgi:hypothetical protein
MAWSGSWNSTKTVYTGTYTATDGSTFSGAWTPASQGPGSSHSADPPDPPLSDYDPYTQGMGPRVDNSDSTSRRTG